jgi:uncharacterized membrane protein
MTESGRSVAPPHAASSPPRTRILWLALAAVSPSLLLLTLLSPWPWLPALIGRAHPLILHFPIALLLLVAGMEAIEVISRSRFNFSATFILFTGSFGAVLAATCGFLLMRADSLEGARVERHLIGGLAVATLAVTALVLQLTRAGLERRGIRRVYRSVLVALCGALLLTGHDGSAITHGEDYLTEHLPWNADKSQATALKFPTDLPVAQWAAYDHVIAPILEIRCVACHNSTNFKGKLVLDQWDGLVRGGKTGPLWVDGKPSDSLLVQRLLLPLADEKHMPPKKKLQPTPAELALLQLWVKAGSPAEGTPALLATDQAWLAGVKKLPNLLAAAQNLAAASSEESHELDPAKLAQARAPVERALAPLRLRYPGVVDYESRASADLRVNASLLGTTFGDSDLAAFATLRDWIVEMDLSDTDITDTSAPLLASMTRLRVLRLNGTRIGDPTASALAPLTLLESISLFRTAISDTGARTLEKLPGLRRIYAEETRISPGVLASFQALRREPMNKELTN